ncbi:class I SAM-dependent methyltransferase [Pelagibius sp.]|uniref:class I SAM-dependent methyltransferase n=1 Tax=Pelagibius sp. TaxID=1931238 RepID=UPI00263195A5|nr:class I SAM-dependent methyltransferase [Pelagibius sp.]
MQSEDGGSEPRQAEVTGGTRGPSGLPVCIACGGRRLKPMDYPLPRNELFRNLAVLVCQTCGFGAVKTPIDPQRLHRYYEDDYAGHAGREAKAAPERYFSDSALMFKPQRSLSQLRLAEGTLSGAPRTILDVGAGFGTTLFLARQQFWPEAELLAVEPDASMAGYLSRAGCRQLASPQQVDPGSCDLIVASHVLEHYQEEEILDILGALRTLLSPRGWILAEVPNSDFSADPDIAGHSHEPHLLFFSKKSLRQVFERCGLRVSFLDTVGPVRRRGLGDRLGNRLRRLAGRPASEYGGNRAALRILAQAPSSAGGSV